MSNIPKSASCDEVIAAHAKWGDKFIVIQMQGASKNKSGQSAYYKTFIKMADGTLRLAFLKYALIKIYGCKNPEERAKRNGISPGFSFGVKTVGKNNIRVGKAAQLIAVAWEKCMKELMLDETNGLETMKIHSILQTKRKNDSGAMVPMEEPLVRIKFRSKNKEDPTLNRSVTVITNTGDRTKAADGKAFSSNNIHEDIRGGSIASGVIDFSCTIESKQGYSLQGCNEMMYIKPSTGFGLDADDEMDASDLADLRGVEVDPEEQQENKIVNALANELRNSDLSDPTVASAADAALDMIANS